MGRFAWEGYQRNVWGVVRKIKQRGLSDIETLKVGRHFLALLDLFGRLMMFRELRGESLSADGLQLGIPTRSSAELCME